VQLVEAQIFKASKLTFNSIYRNRKLGLSSRGRVRSRHCSVKNTKNTI